MADNFSSIPQHQMVADVLIKDGVEGALSVPSGSPVEASVGVTPLRNRKSLTIYNNGTETIYWGYTSGVTAATGTPIIVGEFVCHAVSHVCKVYLISTSISNNVRITEGR